MLLYYYEKEVATTVDVFAFAVTVWWMSNDK
jgi:hypothetical protein